MDQIETAKQHLRFLAEVDGQLNGPIVYLWQKMGLTWEEAKKIIEALEVEGFVLPRSAREDGYRSLPPEHWLQRKFPKRHYAHKKYWRT